MHSVRATLPAAIRRCCLIAAIIAAALVATRETSAAQSAHARAAHSNGWTVYHNERFGFRLEYPAGLFKPGRPPENNDGLEFQTQDGRATIRASGSFNVLKHSPQQLRDGALEDRTGAVVTMDRRLPNGLILSGYEQDTIFYVRIILSNHSEVINTLEIRYPRDLKQRFDAVVARTSRSFRPGRSKWYAHCCE